MKRPFVLVAVIVLAGLCAAAAQSPPSGMAAKPASGADGAASVLPKMFGGWEKTASQTSSDPAAADPSNPALLSEYGLQKVEIATYTKPDRKITVKAATFNDASGAYGAFTFYKTPDMLTDKFGDQGATFNQRVLFYRGNVLVDVTLDRVTAMTAAELRKLGEDIPLPAGPQRNPPLLPTYLPKSGYVQNSVKYVEGPLGLAAVQAPLPASMVEFDRSAEVVTGKYSAGGGNGTLMLIGYPTPQIAGERLQAIANFHPAAGTFLSKRTGPIVAIVAGPISPDEAKALLEQVNYDADITWNENTFFSKRDNIGNLLYNVILLVIVLLVFALGLGVLIGGVKILNRKLFPDRLFDRHDRNEFISLHLRD